MDAISNGAAAPRFIADTMLGRLATWLRILGYDTEYIRGDDDRLLARAKAEGRIVLTRDTGIISRRNVPPCLFIESDHVTEQVRQVIAALRLHPGAPGRRCLRCNTVLEPCESTAVVNRVPEYVASRHEQFWACPACGRIYWAGTHRRRMEEAARSFWT